MQKGAKDNYAIMVDRYEVEVAPAGVIWKYMLDEYPDLDLFQDVGMHATLAGSYISACCLYSKIFRKKTLDKYFPEDLDEELALKIQNKVSAVLFDCSPDWMDF